MAGQWLDRGMTVAGQPLDMDDMYAFLARFQCLDKVPLDRLPDYGGAYPADNLTAREILQVGCGPVIDPADHELRLRTSIASAADVSTWVGSRMSGWV